MTRSRRLFRTQPWLALSNDLLYVIAGLLIASVSAVGLPLSSATEASADVWIRWDKGGRIGDYYEYYQQIKRSGERVIIDGPCLSACTLILAIIPRDRLCATRKAVLGFHAAWTTDGRGLATSRGATRALLNLYPAGVRRWIARQGGLSRNMLFMRGRELATVVPPCS